MLLIKLRQTSAFSGYADGARGGGRAFKDQHIHSVAKEQIGYAVKVRVEISFSSWFPHDFPPSSLLARRISINSRVSEANLFVFVWASVVRVSRATSYAAAPTMNVILIYIHCVCVKSDTTRARGRPQVTCICMYVRVPDVRMSHTSRRVLGEVHV